MCMMNIKDKDFDMDKAVEMIMAIIDEEPAAKPISKVVSETVYDGQGHTISVNGVSVAKGKKRKVRASSKKGSTRDDLNDAVEVALNRMAAFTGKVFRNTTDGIVVRMADADYAVKAGGHATCEFDVNEEGFKPEMNFMTRGKAVNHSSAIAKALVDEIQNRNSECSFSNFENEKSISICVAKASGIRVQIAGEEFTIKISKKRSRCVV